MLVIIIILKNNDNNSNTTNQVPKKLITFNYVLYNNHNYFYDKLAD